MSHRGQECQNAISLSSESPIELLHRLGTCSVSVTTQPTDRLDAVAKLNGAGSAHM